MPPLRSVSSCSPSARARTVTAHSLKAIGIFELVGERDGFTAGPRRASQATRPQQQEPRLYGTVRKSQNVAANPGFIGEKFVTGLTKGAYYPEFGLAKPNVRFSLLRARSVATAAWGLDAQPLARPQAPDRLGAQLLAVEQVAPRTAGRAPRSARRSVAASLGDERVAQRRQRLEL